MLGLLPLLSSHLDLARSIVPEIEAAPGAIASEIDIIEEEQISERVQPGDMIICRLTTPLIKTCIKLIERWMLARVCGRDIGEQLNAIVKAVTELLMYQWSEFGRCLDIYESRQVKKLAQCDGSESQIESLRGRVEAVPVWYQSFEAESVERLLEEIEKLFNDDEPDAILSTVHKAKGLENDRIFVLYPDKLPLIWEGQQDWEYIQEMNLRDVALTRAKRTMIFVHEKHRKKKRRHVFDGEA